MIACIGLFEKAACFALPTCVSARHRNRVRQQGGLSACVPFLFPSVPVLPRSAIRGSGSDHTVFRFAAACVRCFRTVLPSALSFSRAGRPLRLVSKVRACCELASLALDSSILPV